MFAYNEGGSICLVLSLGVSTFLYFLLKVGLLWVYDKKEASFDSLWFPSHEKCVSRVVFSIILGLRQEEKSEVTRPFLRGHLPCSFGN